MDEDHFLHLTDVGRKVAEKIYERHCFFTEELIEAGVDPGLRRLKHMPVMEHVISLSGRPLCPRQRSDDYTLTRRL